MGQGREVSPTRVCHQVNSCEKNFGSFPKGTLETPLGVVLIGEWGGGGVDDRGWEVGGARENIPPLVSG